MQKAFHKSLKIRKSFNVIQFSLLFTPWSKHCAWYYFKGNRVYNRHLTFTTLIKLKNLKVTDFTVLEDGYDKPRKYIQKQRHHLLTKVHTVKAIVFPVVMYGCESWTIKKAEHQRTDAFKLWC